MIIKNYKEGYQIVFKDIENFKAVVSCRGNKKYHLKPAYRIYNSDGEYIALINQYQSKFRVGFDKNGKPIFRNKFFDSLTELKKAVRFAWLLGQKTNK